MQHEPVLLQEMLQVLRPARERGTLVDATVGLGGHAEGLLKMYPHARLVAIDRDPAALEKSRERLSFASDRVTFVRGRHEQLIDILKQHGIDTVDGVLADLGVSSMQLDDASRGFSFRFAANEELTELDPFVTDAVSVAEPGARVAVIAFHSLEDRIVKRAFRRLKGECVCPPGLPVCGCGARQIVKVLTHRPLTASDEEVNRNPRSRSAKLRVAEKL